MIPRTRDRRPPHDLTHLYPEAACPALKDARRLAFVSGSWRGGTKQLRYWRVHVLAHGGELVVLWRYVTLLDGESGQVRYGTYGALEEAARAIETFDGRAGARADLQEAYTAIALELLHALATDPLAGPAAEAPARP